MDNKPVEESAQLYSRPRFYDIAFSWDVAREVGFLGRVFRRHARIPVQTILEPCCGTGRFLVSLPRHGYRVVGYDVSAKMLAYARSRIRTAGLGSMARAVRADMRTARFAERFDAALNSINSIGYLLSDDDILAHLRRTADSLKPGGVYVVHLACAWSKAEDKDAEGWVMERGQTRVKTFWDVVREDHRRKLSFQTCRMEILDRGRRFAFKERHVLRLWFYSDILDLVRRCGAFRLAAIYDDAYRRVPLATDITGEMGNHYYVLRVL